MRAFIFALTFLIVLLTKLRGLLAERMVRKALLRRQQSNPDPATSASLAVPPLPPAE